MIKGFQALKIHAQDSLQEKSHQLFLLFSVTFRKKSVWDTEKQTCKLNTIIVIQCQKMFLNFSILDLQSLDQNHLQSLFFFISYLIVFLINIIHRVGTISPSDSRSLPFEDAVWLGEVCLPHANTHILTALQRIWNRFVLFFFLFFSFLFLYFFFSFSFFNFFK